MTSRRAFLEIVGGSFVLGQLGPAPRVVGGARVGASHAVGHRVLEAAPAPSGEVEVCDLAIVGAGVSGLSAAWRLAASGLDVRVYELEPRLGGTSTWGEEGVVPHPWGAHYLPAPNVEARPALRLLEEMGVVTGWDAAGRPVFDDRTLCHAPEDRIFYEGAWHPGLVPTDALSAVELDELARFTTLVEALTTLRGRDGRFWFQIPLALSSRDPEALALDAITMDAWLAREGFTSPFLHWYVRYATLDDFGGDPTTVSAWAGLHYFAARKLRSQQLEGSHFLVWPEGNGRLARELATRSRARIVTSQLCRGVRESGAGVEVLVEDAASGSARTVRARAAVLATPAFVARRLLADASLPVRESSPWLVANLHVERPFSPDHPWDSVLHGAEGLGYVDASHQRYAPADRTVLTYFRAFGGADVRAARLHLRDAPFEELARAVFRDLAPAHPDLLARTERIDVVAWGHAMPRPVPGFLGNAPFEERALLSPRIAFAHVDVAGMALFEEGQRSGVRAAEALAGALGLAPEASWL